MGTVNTNVRIMTLLQERKKADVIREGYTEDFNRAGHIPFLKMSGRYTTLDYLPFAPPDRFSTLLNPALCSGRLIFMVYCRSMCALLEGGRIMTSQIPDF